MFLVIPVGSCGSAQSHVLCGVNGCVLLDCGEVHSVVVSNFVLLCPVLGLNADCGSVLESIEPCAACRIEFDSPGGIGRCIVQNILVNHAILFVRSLHGECTVIIRYCCGSSSRITGCVSICSEHDGVADVHSENMET